MEKALMSTSRLLPLPHTLVAEGLRGVQVALKASPCVGGAPCIMSSRASLHRLPGPVAAQVTGADRC